MHLKYGKDANEKGVYIIGALGFDSVPAEIGVKYTLDQFPMQLNDVEAFVEFKGKVSSISILFKMPLLTII